jgi:hypothetical protein
VADGGLSEQQGLQTLASEDLPKLRHVVRDRAHRMRAVQKSTWSVFAKMTDGLLHTLVTGDSSLCRILETSRKMSLFWEAAQVSEAEFCKALRSFSFAMQRFDSAALPLWKILKSLPTVFKFLSKVTEAGDAEDQQWARQLISAVTGANAYQNIVRCALATDAMMTCQRFLRLADKADNDATLSGSQACVALE